MFAYKVGMWVGGSQKGQKHAYVIYEWSLTEKGHDILIIPRPSESQNYKLNSRLYAFLNPEFQLSMTIGTKFIEKGVAALLKNATSF